MNNKILLTIMIIVALLIAIYKWILSDDTENEQKQETTEEVKEPANEEKENVKPEETTEEVKNGNDTVNENHK